MDVRYIEFGIVRIEWDAKFRWPLAFNHLELDNSDKLVITQCPIIYWIAGVPYTIPEEYQSDGASVPFPFKLLPRYNKLGWHIFADIIHDYSCDYPNIIPRPIGDAIYLIVLHGIANAAEISKKMRYRRQAWVMKLAVSFYTWWKGIDYV